MSERPIAVGDLVMVMRDACDCPIGESSFGDSGIVTEMGYSELFCNACEQDLGMCAWAVCDNGLKYELHTLERIPPLDELESSKTDEPMKEPA